MSENSPSQPPVVPRREFLRKIVSTAAVGGAMVGATAVGSDILTPKPEVPALTQEHPPLTEQEMAAFANEAIGNLVSELLPKDRKNNVDVIALGAVAAGRSRGKEPLAVAVSAEKPASTFESGFDFKKAFDSGFDFETALLKQENKQKPKIKQTKQDRDKQREFNKTMRKVAGQHMTGRRKFLKVLSMGVAAVAGTGIGVVGGAFVADRMGLIDIDLKKFALEKLRKIKVQPTQFDSDKLFKDRKIRPAPPTTKTPHETSREALTTVADPAIPTLDVDSIFENNLPLDVKTPVIPTGISTSEPTSSPTGEPTGTATSSPTATEAPTNTTAPTETIAPTETTPPEFVEVGNMHLGEFFFGDLVTKLRTDRLARAGINPATGLPDEKFQKYELGYDPEFAARVNPELLTKNTMNFFIIGTDETSERGPISKQGVGNTDMQLLVSVDAEGKRVVDPDGTEKIEPGRIVIMTIPRDVYVPKFGTKINAINNTSETPMEDMVINAEEMTGLGIDGAYKINKDGVENMLNTLFPAGLMIDAEAIHDEEFPTANFGIETLDIAAGQQIMDAKLAVKYARTRHQDGDLGRQRRQRQVFMSAVNALAPDVPTNLSELSPMEIIPVGLKLLETARVTLKTLVDIHNGQKADGNIFDYGVDFGFVLGEIQANFEKLLSTKSGKLAIGALAQNTQELVRTMRAKPRDEIFKQDGMVGLLEAFTPDTNYRFKIVGSDINDTSLNYWAPVRARMASLFQ